MDRISLRINQIMFKNSRETKTFQAYIDATLSIDDKEIDLKYSDDVLAYSNTYDGDPAVIKTEVRKQIISLLNAYVAGLLAKTKFAVNLSVDDSCGADCRLEE